MPITRDFSNANRVADWTGELLCIPNQWGIVQNLGLFSEDGVETATVQFEQTTRDGALIVDKVRGDRATAGKDSTSVIRAWTVPHFPYDDYISPSDVRGRRAYGQADQEETLAAVRMRKMERIRQNHAWTLEYARTQLLTTGNVYAPNGTVSLNYFTEFGVTQTTVNFAFTTSTTEVIAAIEACVAQIQDSASGENVSAVVALCSKQFFAALIVHPSVKAAYQYYNTGSQSPLRDRLGGDTALYRQFTHAGVTFIEVRGNYAGNQFIPDNTAVFLPVGTEIFKTYFAAANKFDLLGTLGEKLYMFEYASERNDKIILETESNFLNAITRPAMVVKATMS